MVVLFATLGFTPQPVLAPLRVSSEFKELVVFFGPPGRPEILQSLNVVRTTCKGLGITLREYPVRDAFDYSEFLGVFTDALQRFEDRKVAFNASGGTRIMVMAATIFCFTNDLPLLYFDEDNHTQGKVVPLRALRSLRRLGETPRAILAHLQRWGPKDMSGLARELGLAISTVTEHVKVLEQSGTVVIQRDGKRRIVQLIPDLQNVDLDTIPRRVKLDEAFSVPQDWLHRALPTAFSQPPTGDQTA